MEGKPFEIAYRNELTEKADKHKWPIAGIIALIVFAIAFQWLLTFESGSLIQMQTIALVSWLMWSLVITILIFAFMIMKSKETRF